MQIVRQFSVLLSVAFAATAAAQVPPSPAPATTPANSIAAPPKQNANTVAGDVPVPEHIKVPPAPPLSPEEMLKSISVAAGYRIELVASEPMISTPVAMQFDEAGRIWVVEMNGYMPNVDAIGEDKPVGRIVVCEDSNGDGRMDKSTVFLDQLVLPRAIMLRKGGAVIAEPPALYWCPDANGDLVADGKELIIPNYITGGNPEHMPNGLLLALDNWIYSAKSNKRYRFGTDGLPKSDTTTFRGQWGICQDDWGRLFYNTNSDPLRADLLPTEYLSRNPNLKRPYGADVQIAKNLRVWPSRVTPGVNRGYQRGILTPEGKLAAFTAASGPVIYRGDQMPELRGDAFVPEPSGNLIKRYVLTEKDAEISASDAYDKAEFITSTSERFRPVNLYNGPDGALYIVDISRGVIQHWTYETAWLRRQIKDRGLEQPLDHGRIYRVVAENQPKAPVVNLAKASTSELVKALEHANGWVRDTAQRLLVERADPTSIGPLRELVKTARSPFASLHALWTLAGLEQLDAATGWVAVAHPEPKLRAAGIRLLDPFAAADPEIPGKLVSLASDTSADVQLQLLLTLGNLPAEKAAPAMLNLLTRNPESALHRSAALSGLRGRELEFLQQLLATEEWREKSKGRELTVAALARCVAEEREDARLTEVVELAANAPAGAWYSVAILDGLTAGRKDPKPVKVAAEPSALATLAGSSDPEIKKRATKVAALFTWDGKPGASKAKVPPLTEAQKLWVEAGRQVYNLVCFGCHLPNGQGQAGLAPPVAESEWVTGPEGRLIRIVLQGMGGPLEINGQKFNLDMPPLGGALSDEQIAQVLSYIRRDFGNEAPVIEAETVAKVRDGTKDRGASWTAQELLNIN